jgi:MFS transporter, ACS family, hexuronate transporter
VNRGMETFPACRQAFTLGLLLSLPLAALPLVTSLPWFMLGLFAAMFTVGAFIVGGIAYATSAFGNGRAGLIAGLGAGSFSALTAITAPIFGGFFDAGKHAYAFWAATAFPVVGCVLWRLLKGEPSPAFDTTAAPRET